MAVCALHFTLFGLIFTHLHARQCSAEMTLFLRNGLRVVTQPDDPYLTGLTHQLGSALFFGLSLGLLASLACIFAAPLMIHASRLNERRKRILAGGIYLGLAAFITAASFSNELPLVSILFGLLCPLVFFVPWSKIMQGAPTYDPDMRRWALCFCMLLLPLVLLKGHSYTFIRDSLIDAPLLRSLNAFYYNHTLLAADVIKPARFRTQNAIVLIPGLMLEGLRPHGSLWVTSAGPCGVRGARLVVGPSDMACASVAWNPPARLSAADLFKHPAADRNKGMRQGIGVFFKAPVIILVPLFLLAWAAVGLAHLSRRHRVLSGACIALYLLPFIPAGQQAWHACQLRQAPELLHAFANAPQPGKRYTALRYLLDAPARTAGRLSAGELANLASDDYARIRLNALLLAAKDGSRARHINLFRKALADPQLNVRTKACWALGETGTPEALALLRKTLLQDSSWYVRDYAYHAIGRTAPVSRSVHN